MDDSVDQQILEAIINKRYPQNALLAPIWFLQLVNKRSKNHLWERDLEEMDKTGLFHPLLKVGTRSTYHRIIERDSEDNLVRFDPEPLDRFNPDDEIAEFFGDPPENQAEWRDALVEQRIVVPTQANFKPWKSHQKRSRSRVRSRRITFTAVYYHPFQMFRVLEAIQFRTARLHMDAEPKDPNMAWKWVQKAWKCINDEKATFIADTSWKRTLLLLLLIEDRYLPAIRGKVSYTDYSYRDGDRWDEWAEKFNPHDALTLSGLTIEEVKKRREWAAIESLRIDKNRHWFPLLRHMEPHERERAEGNSRLAWDYYELNEMLGDFLQDVTGERQPLPDDVLQHGKWKTKAYNFPVEEMNYKRGNALPGILRHFGLDPRSRVWVFVEGMTENNYIEQWFAVHGIHLATSRIMLVSLDSHSGVKSDVFKRLARDARNQEAAVYVLIDNDGKRNDHEKNLQEWIDTGYIERIFDAAELSESQSLPIGALIWEPCFEDHNFTFDQQVSAWKRWLVSEYGEENFDEPGFAEAIEEARTYYSSGSSIKAIETTTNFRYKKRLVKGKEVRFSKPKMGRALAEVHHELDVPINRLLWKIHHIASLDTAVYRPERRNATLGNTGENGE